MRFHFAQELEGVVSLAPALAGTHVLGWLETRRDKRPGPDTLAKRISRAAADDDLVVFPLSRYCLVPPARDALVLGYGGLAPDRIAIGARSLARAIERELKEVALSGQRQRSVRC
jgi:GntR family transcriptional regulator/MocR family aminotransferase